MSNAECKQRFNVLYLLLCIWCVNKLKVRLAVTCSATHLYITVCIKNVKLNKNKTNERYNTKIK